MSKHMEWNPTNDDMPKRLRAAKRVNIFHNDWMDSWWSGHGKDESCSIEGTPNHWFWLAYTLIGITKPEDCPYSEDKPLPVSKERLVSCVNALAGIDDPQAFIQKVRDAVDAGAIDELYLSFIREHLKESPRE